MKTTLVVKDWTNRLARAAMIGEAIPDYHSNLHYYKAHTAMISRGFGPAKPEHEPESVHVRNSVYRPKAGKLDRVRKLPTNVISALEVFDLERNRLQAMISEINSKERALLDSVYEKCQPLKMTEVRGFKNV